MSRVCMAQFKGLLGCYKHRFYDLYIEMRLPSQKKKAVNMFMVSRVYQNISNGHIQVNFFFIIIILKITTKRLTLFKSKNTRFIHHI